MNNEEVRLLLAVLDNPGTPGYAPLLGKKQRHGLSDKRAREVAEGLAARGLVRWDPPGSAWLRLTSRGQEVAAELRQQQEAAVGSLPSAGDWVVLRYGRPDGAPCVIAGKVMHVDAQWVRVRPEGFEERPVERAGVRGFEIEGDRGKRALKLKECADSGYAIDDVCARAYAKDLEAFGFEALPRRAPPRTDRTVPVPVPVPIAQEVPDAAEPPSPSKAQRQIIERVAEHQLNGGGSLQGRVIRSTVAGPELTARADDVLRSCVPVWLSHYPDGYPPDRYSLTLDGLLESSAGGKAALIIEAVILIVRDLLKRSGDPQYSWADVCSRELRLDKDGDAALAYAVLNIAALIGNGRGWTKELPNFENGLPHEPEAVARCEDITSFAAMRRREARDRSNSMHAVVARAAAAVDAAALLQADVLLVVTADVERDAVFVAAATETERDQPVGKLHGNDRTYHDLGTIAGARVLVVQTEMGTATPGGSLSTILTAIAEVRPKTILMVGIAFGVDPKKQPIGQVLVSKQVQQYDVQRVGTGSAGEVHVIPRGDKATATPMVLSRLRAVASSFRDADVKFELLLSGEKLVDNHDYRESLLADQPEAQGGEMEGGGLYVAATEKRVAWCVVKAICDHADGNKRKRKAERQATAAKNAANFVLKAITAGGFTSADARPGGDERGGARLPAPPAGPVRQATSSTRNAPRGVPLSVAGLLREVQSAPPSQLARQLLALGEPRVVIDELLKEQEPFIRDESLGDLAILTFDPFCERLVAVVAEVAEAHEDEAHPAFVEAAVRLFRKRIKKGESFDAEYQRVATVLVSEMKQAFGDGSWRLARQAFDVVEAEVGDERITSKLIFHSVGGGLHEVLKRTRRR